MSPALIFFEATMLFLAIGILTFSDSDGVFIPVPSGEITNYPYLVEIAKTGKKIILSTGMSTASSFAIFSEPL